MIRKFIGLAMAVTLIAACGKETNENNSENTDNQEFIETIPKPALPYDVAPYGHNVCTDASFTLEFDSVPALGTEGKICIYSEKGSLVDEINMADLTAEETQMTDQTLFTTAYDALRCGSYYRIVKYEPVKVEGNSVVVKPHCAKLSHGGTYYITVDESAIVAEGFEGIDKEAGWIFVTKAKPSSNTITVGAEGCDFNTIQGAINCAYNIGQTTSVTISVADGIYEEKLYIRGKYNLTIKGESREGVIIRERNSNALADGIGSGISYTPSIGTAVGKHGGRPVILMESCDKVRFENLTLENTYGNGSQAEVIYNNSDKGRLVFVNCTLISEQDTVCLKGWGWFYGCRIVGDVDFIWGYPETILFEDCDIESCQSDKGYIVQCRYQGKSGLGFVFLNCNLTAETGVTSVYLARSGGSKEYYDYVTYVNCTMGSHIVASGWFTSPAPNPSTASAAAGWKEYGSKASDGSALNLSVRSSYSYILSAEEYENRYADRATILNNAPDGADWAK